MIMVKGVLSFKMLRFKSRKQIFLGKAINKNHRISLTCLQNVEHSPLAHELNDFGHLNVKSNNYPITYELLLYTST